MNQFTFWNENYRQEHITLTFHNGVIWHLSREETRSVGEEWHAIGTYDDYNSGTKIRFTFDTIPPHLGVAALKLGQSGAYVYGINATRHVKVTCQRTSDETDPDTLLGQAKRKSLGRGIVAVAEEGASRFGKRFNTDVTRMRAAILARK